MRAVLIPHRTAPDGPVSALEVEYSRDGLLLWLRFIADGDPDAAAWPVLVPQARADDLWKHTCFEVFVQTADGYVEYNLSPSGQWASYRFTGYRDGMAPAEEVATVWGLDAGDDYVALEAQIELPLDAARIGLSAVIEAADGSKSYWAVAHPGDKPDFHHPDSFVLDLPPSESP